MAAFGNDRDGTSVSLGATAGGMVKAVAQAGVTLRDAARNIGAFQKALRETPKRELERNTRDARGLVRELEEHGWERVINLMLWRSPDGKATITDGCMAGSPKVAEEVFADWLDAQQFKTPPQAHVNSRCTLAASAFSQCEEPVSFSRYIKNEPDDPLKWLDAQVEAVCKAGRL